MSRTHGVVTVAIGFVFAWSLACGGGSDTGLDFGSGEDEGGLDAIVDVNEVDNLDTITDTSVGEDVTGQDLNGGEDTNPGDDNSGVDTSGTDNVTIVDTVETEETEPPLCPCDQTIEAWVCGTDGNDYINDTCAKCAICAPSAECEGCTGTEACAEIDDYIGQKAKCDVCLCNLQDACEAMSGSLDCVTGPSKVCGTDGVTYDNLCVLKVIEANGCDDWEMFDYFGECKASTCAPCAGEVIDKVCGDDGNTYLNKCEMANCPIDAEPESVKTACLGECVADFCPSCPDTCALVCGENGVTYGNECAATTCGNTTVKWEGWCCPQCAGVAQIEVCGQDGNTYTSQCELECRGTTSPCPESGTPACGIDGVTYKNTCYATCKGGGILHEGACVGICEQCDKTLDPLCGTNPVTSMKRTYQNACFAECLGAINTTAGLCVATCVDNCGTLESPKAAVNEVCAEDGITYPNSCFPDKCFGDINYTSGACD